MRIHLLSDLHLERGPYTLPQDLDFDVLVAAGDISDKPEQAIDFLKTVGKPVVLVLGNHDYWSGRMHGLFGASDDAGTVDISDRLAEFKCLAVGTQIHVLERESVVLTADGKRVRFLGATLWTSYGNGNKALMKIGSKTMNDTEMIGAGSWIDASKKNTKTYQAWRKAASIFYDPEKVERYFEPPVALDIHQKTVAWLERQLKQTGTCDHTVVVSHHWPSWDVLVAKEVVRHPEISLDPEYWKKNTHRPDREGHDIYRLAAYGNPMEAFIQRYREQIDIWCCGHVHCPIDVGLSGVRLVANPRGYPYNKGDNLGNAGPEFDERKIVDLDSGVMPALLPVIDAAAKEIDAIIDELGLLANYVDDESDLFQRDVMRATFDDRCRDIITISERIAGHVNSNLQSSFNTVLGAASLWARWHEDREPEFVRDDRDAAGDVIRAARRFLFRLRRIPGKPAQYQRVQALMIAKAVARLEAKGVCVRVEGPRIRRPFEPATLHIENANGLAHNEIWRVINPVRGVSPGARDLFWVVGP